MDPLSAFSLAVNIIQVVDFSSKLIAEAAEIYDSTDGGLIKYSELSTITEAFSQQVKDLDDALRAKSLQRNLSQSENDQKCLGQDCKDVASELLAVLEKLKIRGNNGRWRSFRQALLTIWHKDKIDALENRLNRFREQMIMSTLSTLRNAVEVANQQQSTVLEGVNNIQQDTARIGVAFLNHVEDSSRWHRDLIQAIHRNYQQAKHFRGVSGPAREEEVENLRRKLLHRLRFDDIDDRSDRIAKAHEETFKWIYGKESAGTKRWNHFADWLEGQSNLYWITGKAGSGKSTLMKYIYNNPTTLDHLKEWASPCFLLTAAFFFWNSGSKMQMSQMGLLQSLIFEILSKLPVLISIVFPERWEVCSLFGEDTRPWTWPELVKALKILTAQESLATCFFIDGLDEVDGDHSDLIELLYDVSSPSNVKVCVSSRPWIIFEDAFKCQPSLMLQDLTHRDIQLFVSTQFHSNVGFIELEEQEPDYAAILLEDITRKASGVFLWVHLVVNSLLTGLTNGDRISDLQTRLDLLPPDIEDLFEKMLSSLDPFYFEHASQIFQVFRTATVQPTLLRLSFADEDCGSVFRSPVKPMSEKEELYRAKNMKRRLNSRCKGLLEVAIPLQSSAKMDSISRASGGNNAFNSKSDQEADPEDFKLVPIESELNANLKVGYLHRTAKDFLEKPDVWNKVLAATKPPFCAYRSLCSSFIYQLKRTHPDEMTLSHFWNLVTCCIEYAVKMNKDSSEAQAQLLDGLDRAAMELTTCPNAGGLTFLERQLNRNVIENNAHWVNTHLPWISGASFLHLAAICNLDKYVSIKLAPPATGSSYDIFTSSLLHSALADFNAFIDFTEKPYFSQLSIPHKTIQVLLERGADPNYLSRGCTSWQMLSKTQGMHGNDPEWSKTYEAFSVYGKNHGEAISTAFWPSFRTRNPAALGRPELNMNPNGMRTTPAVEKRFSFFGRRHRG